MKRIIANFSKSNDLLEGNVSAYLDFIRGLSAVLVVMEHLSSRLFVGYGNVEQQGLLVKFLYLLNILGGPSVIIFFVLSGLFISRSVLKNVFEDNWSWKDYLINRLSRLYVVLIPALILTLVLDLISVNYFGYTGYNTVLQNIKEFIGNAFFLQNISVGVYGSNAPLWSLSYEFFYYMLFPLLLLLFVTKQGKGKKVLYLATAILIFSTVGTRLNTYFFIWLIGTAVLFLPRVRILSRMSISIAGIVVLLAAIVLRPLVMTGMLFTDGWTEDLFIVDVFLGLAFGFFIYSLLHTELDKVRNRNLGWFGRIAKFIASFSFSLYLIHYPIINTVYYWSAKQGFLGLQPNFFSVLTEILFVFLICIAAYLFSRLTETKTFLIRKFLLSSFDRTMFKRRSKNKILNEQKAI